MLEKIKDILVNDIGVDRDKITPESTLEDLGLDSLDTLKLILFLEEDLKISIPDEIAEKLKTVNDLILYCEAKR